MMLRRKAKNLNGIPFPGATFLALLRGLCPIYLLKFAARMTKLAPLMDNAQDLYARLKPFGFFALIVAAIVGNHYLTRESVFLSNGKRVTCRSDYYNCPSYRGKYPKRRLENCADVKLVWETCKRDVHDLDHDDDGGPCEIDGCPEYIKEMTSTSAG